MAKMGSDDSKRKEICQPAPPMEQSKPGKRAIPSK
jgi:hypothetical protein